MTRFKIMAMANNRGRALFFLTGELIAGEIHTGMVAHIPQPAETRLSSIVEVIESVENMPEQISLGFHYDSDDQLYAWRQLNLINHDIELSDWH